MLPPKVTIEIDEKAIQDQIEKQIQSQVHHQQLLADINMLSEITCMSVRYLEDEILPDPRVKLHERRRNRKRWWLYKPTIEAITNIVDEWQ